LSLSLAGLGQHAQQLSEYFFRRSSSDSMRRSTATKINMRICGLVICLTSCAHEFGWCDAGLGVGMVWCAELVGCNGGDDSLVGQA
jgi:hypothetical protein